jgi:hypothetical protein
MPVDARIRPNLGENVTNEATDGWENLTIGLTDAWDIVTNEAIESEARDGRPPSSGPPGHLLPAGEGRGQPDPALRATPGLRPGQALLPKGDGKLYERAALTSVGSDL